MPLARSVQVRVTNTNRGLWFKVDLAPKTLANTLYSNFPRNAVPSPSAHFAPCCVAPHPYPGTRGYPGTGQVLCATQKSEHRTFLLY
eukprot:3937745-Rhodomonas_salina.1